MSPRERNSIRSTGGSFFDGEPGIQTILGDERVVEHCVYTSANAVAAGIVQKTAHWKGFDSMRMPYGKEYVVTKSHIGLWSKRPRVIRSTPDRDELLPTPREDDDFVG